jgi:hypothetical protein
MGWQFKIAFFSYLVALLLLFVFALVYLFQSEFMPYHAVAVGQSWEEIDPAFRILILALMKVAGGGWLATVFAIGILLLKPFREGTRWAYWAIPVVGLPTSLSSLYATIYVAQNTPASPPWIAVALGTLLFLIGLVFSTIPER